MNFLRFLILLAAITAVTSAQEGGEAPAKTADELAKELANPNTPLATLNFKNQLRWFEGDLPHADGQFGATTLFQPAFPNKLKNGDMLFSAPRCL